MDQASPQCMDDDARVLAYQQDERLPKVVVHFPVAPGATLTWRVEADSTLAVNGARLWLTRVSSPYDHWLVPGQTFSLQRGERIWLSIDGERGAGSNVQPAARRTHMAQHRRRAYGACLADLSVARTGLVQALSKPARPPGPGTADTALTCFPRAKHAREKCNGAMVSCRPSRRANTHALPNCVLLRILRRDLDGRSGDEHRMDRIAHFHTGQIDLRTGF